MAESFRLPYHLRTAQTRHDLLAQVYFEVFRPEQCFRVSAEIGVFVPWFFALNFVSEFCYLLTLLAARRAAWGSSALIELPLHCGYRNTKQLPYT
jgi:hypothetical protein